MHKPSLAQGPCKTGTGLGGWSLASPSLPGKERKLKTPPSQCALSCGRDHYIAETVPDVTGATEMAGDRAKEESWSLCSTKWGRPWGPSPQQVSRGR